MNDMKCFNVVCEKTDGSKKLYDVGVMTSNPDRAARVAERSLEEGSHISANAVNVYEVDGI